MRRSAGPVAGLVASLAVLIAVPVVLPRLSTGAAGGGAAVTATPDVRTAPAATLPQASPPPTSQRPAAVPTRAASPARPPVRIVARDLGLDAAVDPVGVDPAGLMALPKDARRVGWYRFGVTPGDRQGSAVLAGHVDSRTQGRGALWVLRDAQVGQRIEVTLDDGRRLAYVVSDVERTAKAALALESLFARDGASLLRVVTCGGAYIRDRGGYQDNIVVTAEPVEPR